jgi:hypothetical protein
MDKMIDLHVHSTASDGTLTPTEIIQEAHNRRISAIAITDHDSTDGIDEALVAGRQYDIEVIPGVELSTEYQDTEIHVVGLFIDWHNEALLQQLHAFRDNRDNRNLKMIERLREEGFSITAEEIYARNPDAVIARPHIARYLVDTGQVSNMQAVFNQYIGDGCKCFVDRMKISPMDAVKLIHQANGLAILAHPCLYKMKRAELETMVEEMVAAGLDGIEAIYSASQGSDEKDYKALAAKHGLLVSGGTDFHGSNKPYLKLGIGKGNLHVPYQIYEDLKSYHEKKTSSRESDI